MKRLGGRGGLLFLLLVLACFAVYKPALRGDFLWDDDAHVIHSGSLSTLGGLGRIWLSPGTTQQYYPLTSTTFWLGFHLWGSSPWGFHVLNVLLHSANAFLVAVLLSALGCPMSWFPAFIFLLHPMQVESVAWISELKNTQSTFFYLLSLIFFLRFADRPRRILYGLSFVFYMCALLSKTVTSSLPIIAYLLLLFLQPKQLWKRAWSLVPWIIAGFLVGLETVHVERMHVGATGWRWDFSWAQRAGIAGRALWFYIGKMLWPHPLMFVYPRWNPGEAPAYGLCLLGFAGLILYLAWRFHEKISWAPFTAWCAFLVTLSPSLGFVNVYPMRYSFVADHFQYLASISLIGLLATALTAQRFPAIRMQPRPRMVLIVALLLTLGFMARQRVYAFQSPLALWVDALSKNPGSALIQNNLACELLKKGDLAGAKQHALEAIRLDPRDIDSQLTAGDIFLHDEHKADLALEHYRSAYQEALLLPPTAGALFKRIDIQGCLAEAFSTAHRWKEAERFLEGSLQDLAALDALHAPAYSRASLDYREAKIRDSLALLLSLNQQYVPAIQNLKIAIQKQPQAAPLALHLAIALQGAGHSQESIAAYRHTLQLDPDHRPTYEQLANLLRLTGHRKAAEDLLRDARHRHPEWEQRAK